jgi:hypothetical protein
VYRGFVGAGLSWIPLRIFTPRLPAVAFIVLSCVAVLITQTNDEREKMMEMEMWDIREEWMDTGRELLLDEVADDAEEM